MFLYLTEDNFKINKSGGTFIVENPTTGVKRTIPINNLESVVMFGKTQLTTDVIRSFLKNKIPVFFLTKTGKYFGKLDSLDLKNVELIYRHIEYILDPDISLHYAKVIIKSKIHNSIIMLGRWKRFYDKDKDIQEEIISLRQYMYKVEESKTKGELRGYEGNASKIYFKAFAEFIKYPFIFTKRTRRPPLDEVNAMMGLGYTLLAQTIQMILEIQGIESQFGFFHKPKDLRTLLVLDMMEMYRSWIIDDLIVRISRKGVLDIDNHFFTNKEEEEPYPVLLNEEGLKIFISEYYKTVFTKIDGVFGNYKKLSMIEKDIEILKQSIVKNDYYLYEGFKIK